jgi:hypothetical protein
MGLFSKKKKEEELPPITDLVTESKKQNEGLQTNNKTNRVNQDEVAEQDTSSLNKNRGEDSDLFNLDDFKDDSQVVENIKEDNKTNPNQNLDENQSFQNNPLENSEEEEENVENQEVTVNEEKLDFIEEREKRKPMKKDFFITTDQFKDILEKLDSIKTKIKSSGDFYLKLTDVKAEEEIEYENLRKNFSYIEDHCLELEKIIYEE